MCRSAGAASAGAAAGTGAGAGGGAGGISALNPTLALEGVLLTMYDDRTNLGQQVSANIREFFGDAVYGTVIPRNIRLGEAPSHGVPVILYDARSRGAEAYVALAHEFLRRDRTRRAAAPIDIGDAPAADGREHP